MSEKATWINFERIGNFADVMQRRSAFALFPIRNAFTRLANELSELFKAESVYFTGVFQTSHVNIPGKFFEIRFLHGCKSTSMEINCQPVI